MTLLTAFRTARRLGIPLLGLAVAIAALWLVALPPALAAPSVPASEPLDQDVPAARVSSAAVITIPLVAAPFTLDGACGTDEYAGARAVQFQEYDVSGLPVNSSVFLQHDNSYLYICMQGAIGSYSPNDFASVYLDTDFGREHLATYDDLSLTANIQQYTATLRGADVGGYLASSLSGWQARSAFANKHAFEYKIPISVLTTGGLCQRTFGLAVYHLWVNGVGLDYGWPSNQWWDQPQTWQPVQLDRVSCKPTLPVFAPLPVTVSQGTADGLGLLLQGIGKGTQSFSDTSHTGTPRFTVVNSDTGSFLEQYAGGGFFALNPSSAFTTTAGGALDTGAVREQTCGFLKGRSFFSAQTLPEALPADCHAGPLPYRVTPILAASLTAAGQSTAQAADVVTTGMLVQVPLGVDLGGGNRMPLRGPGGHLSLIFNNTTVPGVQSDPAALASLDGVYMGISAVAVPYSRTLVSRGEYSVHDAPLAVQSLQTIYPGAVITPGQPELVYYAADAAEDQRSLAPVWYFPDAMALVDGHEVDLRGFSDTAVDGFVPSVAIIAPVDGSVFLVNQPVVITGTISGGAPPFTYTWMLDNGDTVTGQTQGGLVTLITSTLPLPHAGDSPTVTVRLQAVDSIGAANQALLSLQPGPVVYLPLVMRAFAGAQTVMVRTQPVAPADATPQSAYWFGVEAGWDYPPYGPGGLDLAGVIPDANGFKSHMEDLGWGKRFFWSNASAWEKDWRDCTYPGGNDCTYGVDRADFVYYAGHGGPGAIYLPSNSHDTSWADANKMAFSTAKWVGFASCQTLRAQVAPDAAADSAPIRRFFPSFSGGARLLLGFNSNMGDVAFGPRFVDNMRVPLFFGFIPMPWAQRTVAEAWVMTAFEMNAGKPAYMWVTGNGVDPFYDRLPGPYTPMPSVQPYPFGAWHWVWWNE
jgi:hypothetical protein